jgi:hypothetical protein
MEKAMSKKHKLNYHELAKNDPNFHDIRAKILLEAAQELDHRAEEETGDQTAFKRGIEEAATELRRMASNARRAHKKHQDMLNEQRNASAAKAEAFGIYSPGTK